MGMPRGAAWLVAVAAFVGTLAGAAHIGRADERASAEKARAHFERGQRLFKVSRYREALEQFKEGFILKDDPVFLYNIAQCHRLLGERDQAITFYRRYLQAAPVEAPNRAEVEKRIRDLERQSRADPAQAGPPEPRSGPLAAAPARLPPTLPDTHGGGRPLPPGLAPAPSPTATSGGPHGTATAATAFRLTPGPSATADRRPAYERWWFWAGIAGVLAAGAAAVLILGGSPRAGCGVGVEHCERL